MNTYSYPLNPRCSSVFRQSATWLVLAALSSPLLAQDDEPEIFTLSPFNVDASEDRGYTAANTMAGSRLKTDLKDVAAPISVFTKELLEDIAATSVNGALEYAVNTVTDYDPTGNGIVESNFQTRIRGISGAGRARNFFETGINADFYNTERLDFSRGPNSILFGIGSPAGIINSTTKRAYVAEDRTVVGLRFGSYNEKRVTLDHNQAITESFAVRVNALWEDSDGYRDFEFKEMTGFALAGTWKATDKTIVRAEGEILDRVENRARPWTPFDGYLGWTAAGSQGAHSADTWGDPLPDGTTNAAGGAIVLMGDGALADQFVWNAGSQQIRQSLGATPTVPGLNTPPNVLDFDVIPRTANIFGAGARSNSDARIGSVSLEQIVNENFSFELAASKEKEDRAIVSPMNFGTYRMRMDVNEFLPTFDGDGNQTGMVSNPDFGSFQTIANGGFGQDSHLWRINEREELRATAAYEIDFRDKLGDDNLGRILGRHRLGGLVSKNATVNEIRRARWVNIHPTRFNENYFNNQNRIYWGNHYDPFAENEVDRGLSDPFERLESIGVAPMANGSGAMVQPSLENNIWRWSKLKTDSTMLALQSYFWDDRIVALLGWRDDAQEFYDSTDVRDTTTRAALGYSRNPMLREISGSTYTRGLVFHAIPTKLSLYYNEANNFQDNGVAEVVGEEGNLTPIGNRSGEGQDYGVKFWLFDNKLGASLGRYETSDANQSTAIDGNFLYWSELIWSALGRDVNMGGRDVRDLTSEGYEFELTANPTDQLTLTFNLKHGETTTTNLFPWAQRYLQENRPAWMGSADAPIIGDNIDEGTTVGDLVGRMEDLMVVLQAPEGRAPFQDRETTGNFFGRYSFADDGALDGLAIGAGLQYRGESLIAYRTETDGKPVYADSYTIGNAMISYQRPLGDRVNMRLQLNVENLFDMTDPQPVQGAEPTGDSRQTFDNLGLLHDGVAYTVYLPVPRRYSLSASFEF